MSMIVQDPVDHFDMFENESHGGADSGGRRDSAHNLETSARWRRWRDEEVCDSHLALDCSTEAMEWR